VNEVDAERDRMTPEEEDGRRRRRKRLYVWSEMT
jgi:hypothetical protein